VLELAISMSILLVAFSMFASTLIAMFRHRALTRESRRASEAIQTMFERMRNEEFADVYRLYNAEPFDDPLGPGTAPGASFDVRGLARLTSAPELPVGVIRFPVLDVAEPGEPPSLELREDLAAPELGMPRDLDRDNVIDGADHAGDYAVLPIVARVEWEGMFGPRETSMYTLLTRYRIEGAGE
jgi:hypothetical protein